MGMYKKDKIGASERSGAHIFHNMERGGVKA
jgi:hypothetical protein